MNQTPWIVFDSTIGNAVCLRCGKKLDLPLPQPVLVFTAATEAFCKMHEKCREQGAGIREQGSVL